MDERLDRSNVDDAPLAGAQRFEERMRHVEDAVEIDRDDVFPVLDHGRAVACKRIAAVDAGIVDQDRDAPDLLGDAPGDRNAVLAPPDVELKALCEPAGLANFLRGRFGRLRVDVEQRHLRALAGIAGRNRAPDSGSRAGDDGDVIFEKWHGGFLQGTIRKKKITLKMTTAFLVKAFDTG